MPKVAKGRRKRAYQPKTRTGCITCKLRRVKCDETRPACQRCTSSSRICDGFSEIQPPHSPPSNTVRVLVNPPFDIHVHTSPQARRSFSFFLQHTCPQLAGFFGSDFWEKLVLQAAYHEVAIRHAIVALGSLHELAENQTATADANKTFALEQYNLSIRALLAPLSQHKKQGIDVCLISSILFACFENMQGRHASAGSHIRSGAKLLRETLSDQRDGVSQHQMIGSKPHVDFYAPLEVLAGIFSGLDLEVAAVMGSEDFKHHDRPLVGTMSSGISSSFSSIEEAKKIFQYGYCLFISSQATHLSVDSVLSFAASEARIAHFVSLASNFSTALQDFRESRGPQITLKEDVALAVLQLHTLNNYVSLKTELLPLNDRSRWARDAPEFKEMVAFGEKIISSTLPGNGFPGQSTSFCLDTGIIIPLYHVASHCQDPIVRRKAIALLHSTSRQEGLWNSLLVAKAAERIIEIQESVPGGKETSTVCPNQLLLSSVQPILELDGRGGRLQYTQPGQGGIAQVHVIEEIFSW